MVAVGYTSGDPSKVDAASVGTVGGPAGPLDASGLIPSAQIPGGGGGGPSPSGTVTAETSYGASSTPGSAATYARGDHTHGTPAAPTPAGIGAATDHGYSPADYGLLAWVGDPGYIAGVIPPTTGIVHLLKVKVPAATTINNIVIQLSGSSTLTAGQNFAAAFDTSGTRLGITADQSSSWATTGSKVCALTAPAAVSPPYFYVALLFNGSSVANMGRFATSTQFNNANLPLTGLRFAQYSSGLTAMPSSITMASIAIDATGAFWAGVS
jgi:hypothetical protein